MAWILTTLALIALAFFLRAWLSKRKIKDSKLPPGPIGFPIFGSLHLLGKFPHHDLHRLAKKYGPIMYMRLGLVPTVVVSSPQAAELILKTNDLVFASRPANEAAKYITYEQKNLSFAPYGSYWRNVRKMCTLELLSNHKINSFMSTRKEELDLLIDYIKDASRERVAVDLSAKVSSLSADISCRMVLGKKYMEKEFDEKGFKPVIHEGMRLAASFNLGDYIPPLAPLDLQGLTKRLKAIGKVFDDFFEKSIDEHIQFKDENRTKDFVDIMLGFLGSEETEYRIGRDNIKAIILDMLVGSMDTSATAIEWTLSELIKHPRVMKKVQKELEEKVGMDRMVEESDLEGLEYLHMVVKEAFRLHPVAPLLIPHESVEDCTIDGFLIPQKTRVIVNVWAIGRDQSAWTDANKFIPERFAGSNIDVRGRDFQLLPFGSGRRGCPGMHLGLTMVRQIVAQLVHCFDWELPNNMLPEELDMTEAFGLATPRANHLCATPTYRLHL
ncbi:cytochrome P450 71AU50-like [Populus alba x Populus x berolinensis]|uniref:Cytochrome P450 71AU50-like n=1 Tax=Populus alba x Populus x berolinensis TaxID=444605 RepID=A0AAD6VWQ8_9ROSI|nr:cytochrome P450 71AU50-like [Populus alba x Populus x berolinensis]